MLLVRDNERKQRHGLSGARRHLQDAVTPGIEGLFEIAHVGILLGVYTGVGEENREVTRFETVSTVARAYESKHNSLNEEFHGEGSGAGAAKLRLKSPKAVRALPVWEV